MTVWNILLVVSLLMNIYCIINIFQAADCAKTELELQRLRGKQIELMQKEIDYLKSQVVSK